jgi:archaellum component FlaG (FlaF/FlaG flagellin family)
MMRFILICFISAFIFSCNVRRKDRVADDAMQQMEQALKDTTTVEIIDRAYNFGSITEGDKVEYNFRFKNTGKKPLVITNASASCGCTVPEKPEKPVMPGDTSFIKVVFNSRGKSGHQDKSIIVSSNAKPPFPDLMLTGQVKQRVAQ